MPRRNSATHYSVEKGWFDYNGRHASKSNRLACMAPSIFKTHFSTGKLTAHLNKEIQPANGEKINCTRIKLFQRKGKKIIQAHIHQFLDKFICETNALVSKSIRSYLYKMLINRNNYIPVDHAVYKE